MAGRESKHKSVEAALKMEELIEGARAGSLLLLLPAQKHIGAAPRLDARSEKLDNVLFAEMPSFVFPVCHSLYHRIRATPNRRIAMCHI
jgi:hypothetical protein